MVPKKIKLYSITLLISFISCKKKVENTKEVLRPVKYEIVGNSDWQTVRTFSGTVKASEEIELSFRTSGIVTVLNAKAGKKVKKGDLIARLDNVQATLSYEQAKSSLNAAESNLKTSKSNLKRVKSLFEKGSNSLSDYEKAKNTYQGDLDRFESAQKKKSIQLTQIGYGIIKAPKNGTIASTDVSLNETVGSGKTIAVLNAGEKLNVEVGLPENIINKVALEMETSLTFSAIEGENYRGRVIEIAPILDSSSSTYIVKIEILNPIKMMKPGMAASITFDFKTDSESIETSLTVPVSALGEDDKGKYVFTIISSDGRTGKVEKKYIQTGELTNTGFKVVSGLKAGDKIATAGLQNLLNGQKIKLYTNK